MDAVHAVDVEERIVPGADPAFSQTTNVQSIRRRDSRRRAACIVASVRAILAARYAEAIALRDLAAAVGVSRFHLARLFRRETGVSIHQELLAIRLDAAWRRIAAGERDLAALALDTGFCDHSHFSRAFRQRFDAAPSEVRRRLGGA